MHIEVSLKGKSRIAAQLADAVEAQYDMSLLSGSFPAGTAESDADTGVTKRVRVEVAKSNVRVAQDSPSLASGDDETVPSADSLSLARLVRVVRSLSAIERLYCTVIRRAAHAADDAASSLDGLQPLLGEPWLESELSATLVGCVPVCQIRRVTASYTHSHLHMIKLDLVDSIGREVLVDSLHAASRILVSGPGDGFYSTADIQEFFRDLGRSRGDRWESFVWEDSILVDEKCVYLMQDISPDSIVIPEVIDAIRLKANLDLSLTEIGQLTDRHLGVLPNLSIGK